MILGVNMNFKVHIEFNLLKWKSNLEDRDMYSLGRFNSMIDFILMKMMAKVNLLKYWECLVFAKMKNV